MTTSLTTTPDQAEILAAGLLDSPFSCLLSLPTGSGKTWLAGQAMRRTLEAGFRAIYLTPLRALANELYDNWSQTVPHPVGIFTGDYGVPGRPYPVPLEQARLLIMTPERFDLCLRRWRQHYQILSEIDLVVVDEFHLLGDESRGARLEGTLMRAMRVNPFLRLLALSATLGNVAELAEWLDATHYVSHRRTIPLTWQTATFKKADRKPDLLADLLWPNPSKTLVFVQSRRRAEDLAQRLRAEGIKAAHHHAGLTTLQRERVETGFRGQEIDILTATPTLELGVNLPVAHVILYDVQQFNGQGYEPLSVTTVWQRAGRAGRPGQDPEGRVTLMVPSWDRKGAAHYPEGKFEPVRSGLSRTNWLTEQVVAVIASGYARTLAELEGIYRRSLAAHQGRLPHLATVVETMTEAGMLRENADEQGTRLVATRLGHIACRHQLSPETVLLFAKVQATHPRLTQMRDKPRHFRAGKDSAPVPSVAEIKN